MNAENKIYFRWYCVNQTLGNQWFSENLSNIFFFLFLMRHNHSHIRNVLSSCEMLLNTIQQYIKHTNKNACANKAQNESRISSDCFSMILYVKIWNTKGCYKVCKKYLLYAEYVILYLSVHMNNEQWDISIASWIIDDDRNNIPLKMQWHTFFSLFYSFDSNMVFIWFIAFDSYTIRIMFVYQTKDHEMWGNK